MGAIAETLERELQTDLTEVLERFRDDEWSTELYRALGGAAWWKEARPRGDWR